MRYLYKQWATVGPHKRVTSELRSQRGSSCTAALSDPSVRGLERAPCRARDLLQGPRDRNVDLRMFIGHIGTLQKPSSVFKDLYKRLADLCSHPNHCTHVSLPRVVGQPTFHEAWLPHFSHCFRGEELYRPALTIFLGPLGGGQRGKFAAVRRALHRSTGRVFAAKYVRRRRRAKASEAEAEARHEVAVLVMGRAHQHIVHLHRVYLTRQEYIILLEFGAGGDLQKLLDDQVAFREDVARALLLQVLSGLRFLHTHKIAHLDIKPQNLIMMGASPAEGVKIVDFGLSRVISQDTELTQIMGTPDYVAPEVINFEPVGLATDMWSVGVLTYVFLTGCTPFGGDTDQETFVNITQAEYDFPDDLFAEVSDNAKDFISGLLLKKTSERLQIDDCLNHPWLCPSVLSSVYPSSASGLYTLSEADSSECPDSAYSSSDNSSPTFLEKNNSASFASNVAVSLCQCPIPEEQQQQQQAQQQEHQTQVQVVRIAAAAAMLTSARRLRTRSNYMSVDMEETLKAVRKQQQRSTRRASLVIDNPRQVEDDWKKTSPRPYNHQSLLNLNQEVLDNRVANDEFRNATNRLRHSESFDCGISGGLYPPWNDYNDRLSMNQSLTDIEPKLSKPWQKLCNGSVLRAVDQLTTNNSPKKKKMSLTKSDLSHTRSDLSIGAGNYATLDSLSSKSKRKLQKCDFRASIAELRDPRDDLRPKIETSSRPDLRCGKLDSHRNDRDERNSFYDFKTSNYDLRSPNSDIYSTKSDLRTTKSSKDLRRSKKDLQSSSHNLSARSWDPCSDLTLSRLDMSLSRLDLAHEQLDQEEALEQKDSFRGDLTMPRRTLNRASLAPLLRGNALHMSFRMSKNRDRY
ncbi:Protein kinase domain [Trinorchestia longiramus]|nr:Protein kinase domain [Trinorchestia longiramus]